MPRPGLSRRFTSRTLPTQMAYRTIRPDELDWITLPHDPGQPARHVAELSERLDSGQVRANLRRYEPDATGRLEPAVWATRAVRASAKQPIVRGAVSGLLSNIGGTPGVR
jgi:hypothetical protein